MLGNSGTKMQTSGTYRPHRIGSGDLRHTGNTFAAASGAPLRDLMARTGHDSERAAMIYQHEARGADQAITSAIDHHVQAEQDRDQDEDGDGQTGALASVG
ncbi:MAG: hypothetical protein ACRDPY_13175 [Streptosporangiaceae bacterium]